MRQPVGSDTNLTIQLLPGWNSDVPVEVWAFAKDGRPIARVPAQYNSSTIVFSYMQIVSSQPVAYYMITSASCCDFNGNDSVDTGDLVIIGNMWQQPAAAPYDQDGDGVITVVDIQRVARWWGMTYTTEGRRNLLRSGLRLAPLSRPSVNESKVVDITSSAIVVAAVSDPT